MRNKYTDEMIQYTETLLLEKKKPSIRQAVMAMCEKFDLEYSEKVRIAINRRILRNKKTEAPKASKIEDSEAFKRAKVKMHDSDKEAFCITWAQNATPTHGNFFRNVKAFAEAKDADLLVIAGRYRNPTSMWTFNNEGDEWWAPDVEPYLDANRHKLHKLLQVLSDVKISPTASTPLSGMNGVTGVESCIIGHPRQHLKSLPVLEGYPHKLLLSTGACTVANYTDSKAGKKGEFHHMLGFVYVEIDGDDFHIKQIDADADGNFYNLYDRVLDGKVLPNIEGIAAAILGDTHVRHNNPIASKAAFKILDDLKPRHTIVHDIFEAESILHWDERDPFRLMQKEEQGLDDLREELGETLNWVEGKLKYNLVFARSNHDDMLDRWLKSTDWRKAKNKKMYLELANILAEEPVAQEKGVLPFLLEQRFGDKIKTLSLDDSFRVLNWELGMHGHLGANGSRGGHTQFKNFNTKNIVGHGHHPHREDGHIMVGTLTHLRVGFNKGASNWMNGMCVIYPDGKAQLIHIINGKFQK